jgi:bacteriocin biosynthesis cyclodehydratase domain-containing protein
MKHLACLREDGFGASVADDLRRLAEADRRPGRHLAFHDMGRDGSGRLAPTVDLLFAPACGTAPDLFRWADIQALQRGIAWLPVSLFSTTIRTGPVFAPWTSPCLRCMELRQERHADDPDAWRAVREGLRCGRNKAVSGFAPFHAKLAAAMAWRLAADSAAETGRDPASAGRVAEFSIVEQSFRTYQLIAAQECDVCRDRGLIPELETSNLTFLAAQLRSRNGHPGGAHDARCDT